MNPIITGSNETRSEVDRLLDEADRLLEGYDFAGSVAAFREAALLAPLADDSLMNLAVAEENERVEFRRHLTRLFPESLDLALAEVAMLVQAKYGQQAVARCTDLLQSRDLTPQQTLAVRHARFQAAKIAPSDQGTFAADFIDLWDAPVANLARVRLTLLGTLVGIGTPALVGALTLIRDQLSHEADLTRVVSDKIEQLAWLQQQKLNARAARSSPTRD